MPTAICPLPDLAVNSIVETAADMIRTNLLVHESAESSRPSVSTQDLRQLEHSAAELGAEIGARVLAVTLEARCKQVADADIAARGLRPEQVRWRREPAYHYRINSTLGVIKVWLAAYRFKSKAGGWITCVPARGRVVARHRTRSTPLALEWECRLAALHPFRQGAGLLRFFSRGKLCNEDNTIARHAVAVGAAVSREWKFLPFKRIAKLLRKRTTRCRRTGLPYVPTSMRHQRPSFLL